MPQTIEELLDRVRIDEVATEAAIRVPPATSLGEVYRLLDEEHARAVLVCEGERVRGIFTDRDVLYRTALGEVAPETPVADLMSRELVTVRPDQRLEDAIEAMNRGGYRHIPLVDREGLCHGMISSRDVATFVAGHIPEAVLNLPPRLHQRMTRAEGG